MAIIFGLLLGVALLLGMLLFRSRCFSCALNPAAHPGSPVPEQKLLNAVPTAFPPTSPRTPESPQPPVVSEESSAEEHLGP